jgi:hypothetical protein
MGSITIDLIRALPKKEKLQLLDVLQQDEPTEIPEWKKTGSS